MIAIRAVKLEVDAPFGLHLPLRTRAKLERHCRIGCVAAGDTLGGTRGLTMAVLMLLNMNWALIFVFLDGSVHFIDEAIDPTIFRALITINGGEVIDDFDLKGGE